ncbi:hypothetical protein GALMADRAFT_151826 [Galerina marginata CBS 339.88]|uniref:Tcp11-domain-containing protein n=1 Tax=Galerina marginata (strain CBS 339.88) TaxID=685588 RepID=A0A067TS91_GALM3|nr:hypothetical protein GALMADRAFT_151826 [Galerina marginata CBS 339.88]
MDDLARHCPTKRKQDSDDCQDPSAGDPAAVADRDPSSVAGPSSNAPRRPWLTTDDNLWRSSPTSPQVSSPLTSQPILGSSASKRPRIDTLDKTLRSGHSRRHPRRSPHKIIPSPLTAIRQGSDIEDIGIVSTADPGPSSGSLLRERHEPESYSEGVESAMVVKLLNISQSPIDFNSPHIPPTKPLINRSTLRELDLDIILRNPVIRHDLLFDPGLQFRPRRKREQFEKYWNAVWEEIQTGCTCVTLNGDGELRPTVCICSRWPMSMVSRPVVQTTAGSGLYTVRLPSRIPALLTEFLEVMVWVIQPLSNTAVYTDPNAIKEQAQEHSAHAAHLRSIFDPALIEQELRHKVFDPSGLFFQIGETLKHHCAPMRDRTVEEMVQIAQQPGPEAFKAVRTCLELLELMKLDIANHQLTQLRPWLLRNTGIFEVKAFKIRFGAEASLHNTREWLHSAHNALLNRAQPILHPSYPGGSLGYTDLTRNQQIFLSSLKGVVDFIFDPSNLSSLPSSPNNSPPPSPISPTATTPPASPTVMVPETLYLDKSRLSHLSSDAVDTTALYMFMLLFRQLVFSDSPDSSALGIKVDQNDMMRLKREIRDIGPACLGTCFLSASDEEAAPPSPQESKDLEQRRNVKQDLVLQIAKRAYDIRMRASGSPCAEASSFSLGVGDAPDPAIRSVAQRWADANMQPGSTLSVFLHNRMRDAVFDAVVCLAYPGRDAAASAGKSFSVDLAASGNMSETHVSPTQAAGMESLTDEIRRLAEKTARLALIHLNTHLPLYETEGFFSNRLA